ncbi:MAG: YhcB family protein [Cobetia marina]
MNESNIDWILAIACFLAGIGIGALCYHLLNANVARNQKTRQKLAERELELTQFRDALNDHFSKASDLTDQIQRAGNELRQHLASGASSLCDDSQLKRRLLDTDTTLEEGMGEKVDLPRDYADNRGTLSEDFGLKPQPAEGEAQSANPPRI